MRRLTSDTGAAAVEFALVLPMLLLLVFGIIDFGRAYFIKSTLTHASREGVRALAMGQTAQLAEQRAIDAATGVGDVSAVASQDGVALGDSVACGGTSRVEVSTSLTFDYITPLPAFLTSALSGGTLSSTGVMRCGG